MSLQRYSFGAGKVFATPTNGSSITPIQVFDVQEASISIKAKTGKARGGKLYNVVTGRSEEDISGKVKFLRNDPRIAAYLFHGVDLTSGMQNLIDGESAVCAASVTVANHTTFLYDLGVLSGVDGSALTRITSGTPLAGQYTCDTTGTYVFSAADATAALPVKVSYATAVSGSGFGYVVSNQDQGMAPFFRLNLHKAYNSPSGLMTEERVIYAAQCTGISFSGKEGEPGSIEIDWEAQANAIGLVHAHYFNGVAI